MTPTASAPTPSPRHAPPPLAAQDGPCTYPWHGTLYGWPSIWTVTFRAP